MKVEEDTRVRNARPQASNKTRRGTSHRGTERQTNIKASHGRLAGAAPDRRLVCVPIQPKIPGWALSAIWAI